MLDKIFNKRFNKGTALEVITEAMLDCTTMGDAAFINGLCTMARELELITQNELADFTKKAYQKAQAAEKAKAEERKALAAQRKAERAEKAKIEKLNF